jgi:hypothetical protein
MLGDEEVEGEAQPGKRSTTNKTIATITWNFFTISLLIFLVLIRTVYFALAA